MASKPKNSALLALSPQARRMNIRAVDKRQELVAKRKGRAQARETRRQGGGSMLEQLAALAGILQTQGQQQSGQIEQVLKPRGGIARSEADNPANKGLAGMYNWQNSVGTAKTARDTQQLQGQIDVQTLQNQLNTLLPSPTAMPQVDKWQEPQAPKVPVPVSPRQAADPRQEAFNSFNNRPPVAQSPGLTGFAEPFAPVPVAAPTQQAQGFSPMGAAAPMAGPSAGLVPQLQMPAQVANSMQPMGGLASFMQPSMGPAPAFGPTTSPALMPPPNGWPAPYQQPVMTTAAASTVAGNQQAISSRESIQQQLLRAREQRNAAKQRPMPYREASGEHTPTTWEQLSNNAVKVLSWLERERL